MGADDGAVGEDPADPLATRGDRHRPEEVSEPPRLDPPPEPVADRGPLAEVAGEVPPGDTRPGGVQEGLEEHPFGEFGGGAVRRGVRLDKRSMTVQISSVIV